jgi:hypothetical protein
VDELLASRTSWQPAGALVELYEFVFGAREADLAIDFAVPTL